MAGSRNRRGAWSAPLTWDNSVHSQSVTSSRPGFTYRVPGRFVRFGLGNDRSYRKCAGEDGSGADGYSGRRSFDKTVSSKPLAFAAGAAAMGIQCRSGTQVRVGGCLSGDSNRPARGPMAGSGFGLRALSPVFSRNGASADTRGPWVANRCKIRTSAIEPTSCSWSSIQRIASGSAEP